MPTSGEQAIGGTQGIAISRDGKAIAGNGRVVVGGQEATTGFRMGQVDARGSRRATPRSS